MSLSPSITVPRRRLAPRLVGSFIAVLALLVGPLAFAPAQAAGPATITGSVSAEGAESLEGISVELQEYDEQDEDFVTADWASTDESGAYTFGEVATGAKYRVRVEGTDGYVTAVSASFTLTQDMTVAPITLQSGGFMYGTVTEAGTDAPIESATVTAHPVVGTGTDWDNRVSAWSNEDGAFTLEGLDPARSYKIEISDGNGNHVTEYYDDVATLAAAKVLTVTKGGELPLGAITLDVGASFSGTLQATDGGLVEYSTIAALRMVDGQPDYENAYRGFLDEETGRYTISTLPAGSYKIEYSAWGFFNLYSGNQPTVETAEVLTVGLGDNVDLGTTTLERTAAATGTVLRPNGSAFSNVLVEAFPVVDGKPATKSADYAYTDEAGLFTFAELHAGTYQLRYRDGQHKHRDLTGETFTVAGGASHTAADVRMVAVPAPAPVKKKAATVSVSAKGAKKKATFKITVKASGVTPTGKVTVKLGSKTLKSVTLKKGKATVTVTKQKKGKRTYKVVYAGDSKVLAKTVTTKKVTIK